MSNKDLNDEVRHQVEHYLSLNYHKRLYQDEDGSWIVEVDDLPGCVADGNTPDEAVKNLFEALTSWLRSRIDANLPVPEPSEADEYSGRILLRMPRFLHRRLSLQARAEGASLNQYLVSLLSDASARVNRSSQLSLDAAGALVPSFPITITNAGLGACRFCYVGFGGQLEGWQDYGKAWGVEFPRIWYPQVRGLLGQPEPKQDLVLEKARENCA
jgi:antitoxin HicB